MDEPLLDDAEAIAASDEVVRALCGQREASRRALAEHRERFRDLEGTLAEQLLELDRALQEAAATVAPADPSVFSAETVRAEHEHLGQLREAMADQQTEWQQLQIDFAKEQAQLLAEIRAATTEQLAAQRDARAAQAELEERRARLEAEERELDGQLQQVETQSSLLSERLADVERRSQALDDVQERLQHAYSEQSRVAQQQESERAERSCQFDELAELRRQLQAEQEQIAARNTESQNLRRRVAKELRAERSEMLADLERRRTEIERLSLGDQSELKHQLLVASTEMERMRDELTQRTSRGGELATEHSDLKQQLRELEAHNQMARSAADKALAETQLRLADFQRAKSDAESQAAAARSSLAQARDDLDQLRQRLAEAREKLDGKESELTQVRALATERTTATAAIPVELTRELETLRTEREELLARVEQFASAGSASGTGDAKELEHLRRRLELALQDLREQKSKNAELETACAKAKSRAAAGSAAPAAGPLDWEAQKQRILAQLEEESNDGNAEHAEERLSMEGTIRLTDEIIAQKDRELSEAQRLLEEQSNHIGGMAVGANAIAALLDQDELIRSEREQLKQLQEQLQEKLRAAEIDLSMERAKIGRERSEFREKIAALEAARDKGEPSQGNAPADNKKPGRRWLNRLGLRDGEGSAE